MPGRWSAKGLTCWWLATNEGSYGYTPASDQFIGMTRMRSAETGLDLVHAAVTGKSVIITDGGVLGETTGLGTREVLYGEVEPRPDLSTVYVVFGDWVMVCLRLPQQRSGYGHAPGRSRGRDVMQKREYLHDLAVVRAASASG